MTKKVIKRNGEIVDFNSKKIYSAILRAMKNGSGIVNTIIAENISTLAELNVNDPATIEEIEKYIYEELISHGEKLTAYAYKNYKEVRADRRNTNALEDSVLGLINCTNEEVMTENANKVATLVSTQRDLMAGEVSKHILFNYQLPANIVVAHQSGIIKYHDADYGIQPITNCFSGDTEFITDLGVRKFNQCQDGQIVQVLDKNSEWQKATVKKYEKQKLQTVTISSGRTVKKIRCTSNHRWLLKNGEITTNLKVGDKLWLLQEQNKSKINPYAFCLGFILGDGSDYCSSTSEGVRVRLCGDKIKHLETFLECGYSLSKQKIEGCGDIWLSKHGFAFKYNFINHYCWRYMNKEDLISLFMGYYSADGHTSTNRLTTSNEYLAQMIREISALAGYHITSENTIIRDTSFKEGAILYDFHFMFKQPNNRNWVVKDIDKSDQHKYDTWCVEQPVNHTFTLEGGVVTGNCGLVPLDDLFANGTVINKMKIETPKSLSTAMTLASQVAQIVASCQYGE